MALSIPLVTVLTGVSIPSIAAWLGGKFPSSLRDTEKIRDIALGSVVGIMVAGLAFMATAQPTVPAAAMAVPYAPIRRSVSDVTAQLGRYAGGINYPGQIRDVDVEGEFTDGSLIFID